MALLNVVLPKAPSSHPRVALSNKENQVLGGQVQKRALPSRNKGSRLNVKCLKGELTLPKLINGVIPGIVVKPDVVTRKDFPSDFMFGVSTSAFQTEGPGDEGGRGPSTWDAFIQDSSTEGTEIAVDSYNRYKEDVQLLKNMGADTYRLSFSWSRILPKGTVEGGINEEGITFYNNFIDELIANGIVPFVTLFHFDLPQALQDDYMGFLSPKIVDDFKAFADICFKNFGDRVKHWTTINEPQVFGQYGYKIGMNNPNADALKDPFTATHHIILAHAAAAKHYKENYQSTQGGEIGISLVCQWFEPISDSRQDIEASHRALDFLIGWLADPIVYGDYPFIMQALAGDALPTFTDEEKEMVKGSYDFLGVNYYTSRYAEHVPYKTDEEISAHDDYQHATLLTEKDGIPIGETGPGSTAIYIYPKGLQNVLGYVKQTYQDPKMYITENGYPDKRDDTIPVKTALEDDARIKHIYNHLYAVREGIKQGANVKGYIMWALMDCMEMGSGYGVRFGLNYVDYLDNLKRYPKKSAKWLKSFNK